jgi:PknH-like extracellular domain
VVVGRRFAALPIAAAVVAGCAPTGAADRPPNGGAGGTTAPATTAAPMLVRELPGLLVDADQINTVMDATDMQVIKDWSAMYGYNTPGGDCAGAWAAAWRPVYDGSGWMGVRGRTVRKPGEVFDRVVYESVVAFPLPADATAFYAKQAASWKTCNGRDVDERDLDVNDATYRYTLEQVTDNAGMLSMTAIKDDDSKISCQHALTVRNNVAVDIRACGVGVRTQAGVVASAIASKVPGR